MNIILVALNAKFIHSSLAVHSLYAHLDKCTHHGELQKHVTIKEFTINHREELIVSELFGLKPDVLAFSCYVWNIEMILSIVKVFRKIMPDVKIVLGGPEVSYWNADGLDADSLRADSLRADSRDTDLDADFIICGEGEEAFRSLVQSLVYGVTNHGPLTKNPSDAPLDYTATLLPLDHIPFVYQHGFHNFENRIIYYETSRGCINRCGFCLTSATHGVRFLPLDRAFDDLSIFLSNNVRQVKFVDRTFNCNKQHAMAIWEYLIRNDNNTTNFHFEISGDMLDDEMIDMIGQARSGLFQFEIGVQSTNPKTLSAISRDTDTAKLLNNVRKLRKLDNVHLHLDLIVGLPYEDRTSFIKSFNDVMACSPHQLQVGFLKLLRGSALRRDADKYGMKFHDKAPYEILANDFIGYVEINRIKKIEHMVEKFYNSGGFDAYIEHMMPKFKTAYDFYEALSVYWEDNEYHMRAHKWYALYTILYEFGGKSEGVRHSLSADILRKENVRNFPEWV